MHWTEKNCQEGKSPQFLFMQVSRHHAGKCFQKLNSLGLHPSQMPFMMMVYKNDGCSQKEMAELLDIKPPTVNVSIQRLEKAGILSRRRDEKDQRIMRVTLTDKGREAAAEIKAYTEKMEKLMFQGFSEAELCLMCRFLEQILTNLDSIPEDAGERNKNRKEGAEE